LCVITSSERHSPAHPYSETEEEEEEVEGLTPRWLNRVVSADCIPPINGFRESWTRGTKSRESRGDRGTSSRESRGGAPRTRASPQVNPQLARSRPVGSRGSRKGRVN